MYVVDNTSLVDIPFMLTELLAWTLGQIRIYYYYEDLKLLKMNNATLLEIKYVSHLLRHKINGCSMISNTTHIADHDKFMSKNFWGYVKRILKTSSSILPTFPNDTCTQYFLKALSSLSPTQCFSIPSWIPTFQEPDHPFPSGTSFISENYNNNSPNEVFCFSLPLG